MGMGRMTRKTVTLLDQTGTVFFDDGWDAWGWRTTDFTNGPFDSVAEAEEALLHELQAMCDDADEDAR